MPRLLVYRTTSKILLRLPWSVVAVAASFQLPCLCKHGGCDYGNYYRNDRSGFQRWVEIALLVGLGCQNVHHLHHISSDFCSEFGVFQPFLFNAMIFHHRCSSSPGLRSLADCCRAPSVSWPYPIPLLLREGGCPSGKPTQMEGNGRVRIVCWFLKGLKGKGVNKIMFIQWNDEGTSFLPIVGWRCRFYLIHPESCAVSFCACETFCTNWAIGSLPQFHQMSSKSP